jgi:hypothetical protein
MSGLTRCCAGRRRGRDRQMNAGNDILVVRIPGTITLQQLDLKVIERIEIGEAIADRARQQRRDSTSSSRESEPNSGEYARRYRRPPHRPARVPCRQGCGRATGYCRAAADLCLRPPVSVLAAWPPWSDFRERAERKLSLMRLTTHRRTPPQSGKALAPESGAPPAHGIEPRAQSALQWPFLLLDQMR